MLVGAKMEFTDPLMDDKYIRADLCRKLGAELAKAFYEDPEIRVVKYRVDPFNPEFPRTRAEVRVLVTYVQGT